MIKAVSHKPPTVEICVWSQVSPCGLCDEHLPQATLTMYQKGFYYSGIKILNSLPRALKDISCKPGKFKTALRGFLQTHSFYSLDEFFDKQWYFLWAYHTVYILSSIYWNTKFVKFMLLLLILYCISTENFKCMALLYYRTNMLTIPISIGYTAVYGILGNKIKKIKRWHWDTIISVSFHNRMSFVTDVSLVPWNSDNQRQFYRIQTTAQHT
jgi:hypothetical protein